MQKTGLYLAVLVLFNVALNFAHTAKPEGVFARGYCGDGIMNGNEDCDGSDIKIRSCKVMNGGEGEVRCQSNCVYDISQCGSKNSIRDIINDRIGGRAEVCKCTFGNNACAGGCAPDGYNGGQVSCLFMCDNAATCRCEGKMETHIEYCNIDCNCISSPNNMNTPSCSCKLDECEIITVIAPNIGDMVMRTPIAPPVSLLPPPPPPTVN